MKTKIVIMLLEVFAVCSIAQDRLQRIGGLIGNPSGGTAKIKSNYYNPLRITEFKVSEIMTNGFISRHQNITAINSGREFSENQAIMITGIETSGLISGGYWKSDKLVQVGVYTNMATKEQCLLLTESKEEVAKPPVTSNKTSVSSSEPELQGSKMTPKISPLRQGMKNTDTYTPHRKLGQ